MSQRPAESWYEATARREAPLPPLRGDVEADVCVVGAGISGCSTALHLAERGYKVVLLEEERVGYGASGRSGGQIIPGYACGMAKLAAQLGQGDAKRLWDYGVESVELTRHLIMRHQIDCDLAWGHMHVGIKPRQRDELKEWQREQEDDYGYRKLRFMEKAEVEEWVASKRYLAGLYDAGAGHLHPLRYTIGVGKAAVAAGVQLHENSAVTSITHGPTVTVRTAGGSVRAKFVALCANVGHVDLSQRLARRLIGVASYIVATKPLGAERAAALIKDNIAVADINWIIDYYRRSSDHRLLFGGRVSY
jgi:gamma-glutamylputrescine oxidase